jgi:hypothetical protein
MNATMMNQAEKTAHQIVYEVLAINYGVIDKSVFFDEEARQEILDDSSFKLQESAIERICIYQSEYPSLFINIDDNSDPDEKRIVHLLWGGNDVSFYEDLDEKIEEQVGCDYESLLTLRFDEDAEDDDEYGVPVVPQKHAAFCAQHSLDKWHVTLEMIFYYRQAHLLERLLKQSTKFKVSDSFRMTVAFHDSCENIDENLWNYTQKTIDTPLSSIVEEAGLAKF